MTDIYTRQLQLKLLEIMKIFHDTCEKNGIIYYMLGGTMLGSVRHKGFIPWDDDMDVGVPREDYEKLLRLPANSFPDNIRIKTPYNSSDLIFPYSKIMNIDTTLVEDRLDGITEGIYIDIFPLDGAGNSYKLAKMRYICYYWKQGLLYNNQDHGDKKSVLRRMVQRYARLKNTRLLYNNVERHMKKKSFNESSIVGNYPGAWGFKEFMEKNIFGKPTLYDFENHKFFGSENADKYLKSLYGDYMQLPPIGKRKSHHRYIYLNLEMPYEKYEKSEFAQKPNDK
jgi:lipopolysaccharide cholinephosphotransferase